MTTMSAVMPATPRCPADAEALRFGLALQAVGRLLEHQGWTAEQVTPLLARAENVRRAAQLPAVVRELAEARRERDLSIMARLAQLPK